VRLESLSRSPAERMDDRSRALEVLRQPRELLVDRLCQRIVDTQDEILDDALGQNYSHEIESLHDQLGLRLSHVNSLLANLPVFDHAVMGTLEVGNSFGSQAAHFAEAPSVSGPISMLTVEPGARLIPDESGLASHGPTETPRPVSGLPTPATVEGSADTVPRPLNPIFLSPENMDKKAKKRIDLLQEKLQKLRQQLAGARKQPDDPEDVPKLEREIATTTAELEKLKQS